MFLLFQHRLNPRPSLLLDHFFIPHAIGHLIAAVLCWYQQSPSYIANITVSSILMVLSLVLLMRSIAKAVRYSFSGFNSMFFRSRLKEIMEYTSATTQGTLDEYLALVDRENLDVSDIDDQGDEDEL